MPELSVIVSLGNLMPHLKKIAKNAVMPNEKFLQRSFLKIYGLFGILKCQQAPIQTHRQNPPTTHVWPFGFYGVYKSSFCVC